MINLTKDLLLALLRLRRQKLVVNEQKVETDITATVENGVAQASVDTTEPVSESKTDAASSTTLAGGETVQVSYHTEQDEKEPAAPADDKPEANEPEIEMSSTSSAALIGEIEETVAGDKVT